MHKNYLLTVFFTLFTFFTNIYSQNNLWEENSNTESFSEIKSSYILDPINLLKNIKSTGSFTLNFPNNKGEFITYKIKHTNTLSPELSKKFNSVYTFKGISLDGNNNEIRFSYSKEFGLKGSVFNKDKKIISISPKNSLIHYFNFNLESQFTPYECQTKDILINNLNFENSNSTKLDINDGNLRRYRIAISTTAEYSNFFLDGTEASNEEKKTKVLTAVAAAIERINGLFEIDLGITLQLIENTDELFFFDITNDPYSFDFNNELQNELDSNILIGSNAYDIGHLLHYDNETYGNAGCIGCVCTENSKGSGFTAHVDPSSDNMNIIFAHELGHQFGAFHTQSSSFCRSGFNSEVEPGSGSTIMSYAGICEPNVQSESDFYYNYTSIRDIAIWTIQDSNCAELIPIQNSPPIIQENENYSIPTSTPFVLEANAFDSNQEDVLSYCWEQADTEYPDIDGFPSPTQTLGPVFRSFAPTNFNKRYFPNLQDIVNGNLNPTWEVLPAVERDLNFSLVVRDNSFEGGQTTSTLVNVNVVNTEESFLVLTPNSIETEWNVGEEVNITWNVASTNESPINTSLVDVYLSTDGGLNFDTKILENIENNGEANFILTDVPSTDQARIMVKAVDNIFFSINSSNFSIIRSEFSLTSTEPKLKNCKSDLIVFDLSYNTFLDFIETVNLSVENLVDNIDYEFSESTFSDTHQNGSSFSLTLNGTENLEIGSYTFLVKGNSEDLSIEKSIELTFSIFNDLQETKIVSVTPLNNTNTISIPVEFNWENIENVTGYLLEVSTNDDFTENTITENTTANNITLNEFEYNSQYYWRVIASNPCEYTSDFDIFTFSTVCSPPNSFINEQITQNTISLVWEDSTNNSWEIEYGISGFEIGSGVLLEVNETSLVISELNSGTSYDFYLRSKCTIGGHSMYEQPLNITTLPNYCNGDHFYDTGGESGEYNNNEDYLVTIYPENENERVRAIFNTISIESGWDYLHVYDGVSDTDNLIETFSGEYSNIEITPTNDFGALTFKFTSDVSVTRNGWDAEITCEERPLCEAPINFSIDNLTAESVNLNWIPESTEDTNWIIEYGELGFELGNGTEITSNETSLLIENLNSNTEYVAYIKTICSDGSFSSSNNALTFKTHGNYCNGDRLYDTGGENGEYNNNEFYTLTLFPSESSQRVKVIFDYIDIATDYLIIYDGDTDQNNILAEYYDTFTTDIELTSTHSSGALTLLFFSDSSITSRGWDAEVICEEKPCGTPFNILASSITKDNIIIEWNTYATGLESIIEYGEHGFVLGTGMEISTLETSLNIENLNSGTTYDIYIKNSCLNSEVYSNYSELNSFTTSPDYCSGDHFHDTGGLFGDYKNNENYTLTIYPDSENERIRAIFNSFNLESCCDKLTIYDGETTNDSIIGIYYVDSPGEIFSTHQSGALTFNFDSDGSITDDGWDAYIICESKPNCESPENFEIINSNSSSVEISWNTIEEEINWSIEYGISGFNRGEGTIVEVSSNNISIENLESYTEYDIYFTTLCSIGGTSDEALFSFLTDPDYCSGDHFYDTGGLFGDYEDNENYIETIFPTNQESERVRISFLDFYTVSDDILYIYDGPDTSYQLIAELSGFIFNENTEYVSSHETGALTFAFISSSFFTATGWDAIITCEAKPSCNSPENILATNIDTNTAEIIWGDIDETTSWSIEYGISGFQIGTGTTINSSQNSVNLILLNSYTEYDVYIKALCADNTFSDHTKISFNTLPDYCNGDIFYGSGKGFDNYENNEDYITTIYPEGDNERVRATFTYFSTEISNDVLYIYDGDSIENNLIGQYSGYIFEEFELVSSHSTGALTFNFVSNETITDYGWVASINCEQKPSCTAPLDIEIVEVSANNVSLVWITNENISNWHIEYGVSGFNQGNGSTTINNMNSIDFNLLESNTYYDVYIANVCTDNSISDYTKFTFKTEADYCSGDLFYDTGENSNYNNNENYITTIYPDSDNERIRLLFTYFYTEQDNDILYVYNGNSTENNLLGEFSGYIFEDIEIVSTHQTGALTLKFISNENLTNDGWVASISCETQPSCFPPENISISDITTNSINIQWNDGIDTDTYVIEYGESNFEIGEGIRIETNETNYIIPSLESGTYYDIYLYSICTDESNSEVSTVLKFKTLCQESIVENEYIIDGSFECANTSVWDGLSTIIDEYSCEIPFTVLENSEYVCFGQNVQYPTDGNLAAFTSFDGTANNIYTISQLVKLPEAISEAYLSFDFNAEYEYLSTNYFPKTLFVDLTFNDNSQSLITEIRLGNGITTYDTIDLTFEESILEHLSGKEGTTIKVSFNAFVPENFAGPSRALLDNVSLIIEEPTLSITNVGNLNNNNFSLYPQPNNGTFTLKNTTNLNIKNVIVYDISGRKIQESKVEFISLKNNYTIKDAASGIYFIHLKTIDGTVILKTIVE